MNIGKKFVPEPYKHYKVKDSSFKEPPTALQQQKVARKNDDGIASLCLAAHGGGVG